MAGQLADLGVEVVYSASSQSAVQTANCVAEALDVKMKVIDRLTNLNQGLWQGRLIDEVKQTQPKVYRQWQEEPDCICPPEGEMLNDARERVRGVLTKLVKKHKHGVVGLVVPEPLASLVRCQLTAGVLGDLWKTVVTCGCWEVIEVPSPTLVS
jgi:broad specificity phosphatase PhoE